MNRTRKQPSTASELTGCFVENDEEPRRNDNEPKRIEVRRCECEQFDQLHCCDVVFESNVYLLLIRILHSFRV